MDDDICMTRDEAGTTEGPASEWVKCTVCERSILLLPDPIKRINGEEPAESWFHSAEPTDHKAVAP